MDKKTNTQTCNSGGSPLSCGTSCNAGIGVNDDYEAPDLICLNDENESIGENTTKQTCNTGGSDLSHGSSCSAGFSEDLDDEEDEESDDSGVTTCRCNTRK